jgi:cell fate (sporulation/competence/biofilm development) regulator YlbF (YheA/YmcA/DUF963 family)
MLIEKARELGVLLSESPEFIRMNHAKCAITENEAISRLLDEFNEKRARLAVCLSDDEGSPDEAIELTNDIERLHEQIDENPILSELLASEQSFYNLLSAVNKEINACIGRAQSSIGHCATCGGCPQAH